MWAVRTWRCLRPPEGTANLYGLTRPAASTSTAFLVATLDAGYMRTSDVFGLGHGSYVLTFLAGPVFYLFDMKGTRVSVRVLAGAGLVDSAIPTNGAADLQGWVARPSFVAGVGVQHSFIRPFALRVDTDYLRTSFVDPTATVQPQNNLRMTVSVVFHLKDRGF